MKKSKLFVVLFILGTFALGLNWAISSGKKSEREQRNLVDTRIDNLNYWVKAAEAGLVPFNPEVKIKPAVFTGSEIVAYGVLTEDSPDVPVTGINSTQSENSIFVSPNDANMVLNSNNSTPNPPGGIYGANDLYTFDAGETWEGEVQGAGGSNSGDPTTAIGLNNRWYVNYISNPGGMGISYSDDQGDAWTVETVAPNPGSLADKNHMWIDNSPSSAYEGNLYVAWTNFGGGDDTEIGLSYSSDNGQSWTLNSNISGAVNAGSHNQGVNLSTGPNGEVYAVWAIYDGWPTDESAIGFAKSLDGGVSWDPATRVITNIRGIRNSGTGKNMRVNSFPVATVDNSNGPDRGAIYITWANIGTPGVNTGSDMDIYVIKSTDDGANWTTPVRVNQDESGQGKQHYFPWITCDPSNGVLSVVFYDDRNVSSSQIEVYCANSEDGGDTWEDFKVSDVSSTPAPIPGLASGYFGDYIGITAQDGWVYPTWTDNRSGTAMTYVSPYQTNPLNRPKNLTGSVTFETGAVDLIWTYETGENFLYFNLYRDGDFLTTVDDTVYTDMLPDYGLYTYQVTAAYTEDMESGSTGTEVQWGDAHISVSPVSLYEHLVVDSQSTQYLTVINTGQLDLDYSISAFVGDKRSVNEYCDAMGGGDEYISRVQVGDIDNASGSNFYRDYTEFTTNMRTGESYSITVTNGKPYEQDYCGAWIDWDGNGVFDEEMIVFNGSPGNGPYTATIIPPVGSKTGETVMRIRIRYNGDLFPCGNTQYGEVEDYGINIQGWLDINPVNGTILPGDTSFVAVHFDATDMDPGMYSATAKFTSNDPVASEVDVDIMLQISQMVASITADKYAVCVGENAQLSTTVAGPSDNLSYSWYSVPEGFTAETMDVLVAPEVSTWYYVIVADTSGNTATDSVYIEAYPLPVIDLGADSSVCGVNTLVLDAGNPGSTYLWSTGETTQTIEISTNEVYGEMVYSVEVTNATSCTNSGERTITWVNCTGVDELNRNMNLSVYPNPNNGEFSLQLNALQDETVDIFVLNELGAVIYSKENISVREALTLTINLQEHAQGIYSVVVRSEKGVINKKVVVK
ncbi:MAG: GEVED domain-containing protein [Bacteroidales bacterium]|nr:GEVED domain-containing protein [Bacteroidales bacterium]MCF6341972.1 GEVED domain-containing protein [Bacteroidales bacterium]